MTTITELSTTMQALLTTPANRVAKQTGFAQTLVVGGLAQPAAVGFMRALLEVGVEQVAQSEAKRTGLPQFNGVYLKDYTRLVWPKRGVKIGVRWEIQHRQLQAKINELQQNDQKTGVVEQPLPPVLYIRGSGFFKLSRFQEWNRQGVY